MSAPMTPAQVAARVAQIIRTRPELHDQGSWWSGPDDDGEPRTRAAPVSQLLAMLDTPAADCGTTCCVAGWAAVVTAPPGAKLSDDELTVPGSRDCLPIGEAGAVALGITLHTPWDIPWLFSSDRTRDEVLDGLDRIAAGAQ